MTLIERDDALAALGEMLADATNGRGRVAMVSGPVACGKSALMYAFAEQAVDLGVLPVTAAASYDERHMPLGVIRQLIHNAPLLAEDRRKALKLAEDGVQALMAADSGSSKHLDTQTLHALCSVLLEPAQDNPLLIIVDDVHHADRGSQLCLKYLVRQMQFTRVLAAFGHLDRRKYLASSFHTELLRQPHCRLVQLLPLTANGVGELVARLASEEVAEQHAAAWHSLSGGNPVLVRALAAEHRESEHLATARYRQAVLSCLRRAEPDLREVARGLAVLNGFDALDSLVAMDAGDTAEAVDSLIDMGLITSEGFRHDSARAAVAGELTPVERAELYGRGAEWAWAVGDAATTIADYLLQADEIRHPWAVSVLENAARVALREGHVERAIDCLRLARRYCTDTSGRARITTALVRAEWCLNPSAPTVHITELMTATQNGELAGGDAIVLTEALLWHGRFEDARGILGYLHDSRDRLDQDAAAELAVAGTWLSCSYPTFLTHLPEAVGKWVRETKLAAPGSRRLSAAAALTAVLTDCPQPKMAGVVERILRNAHLDEVPLDTVENAVLTLTYGGWLQKAASWCDHFVDEAGTLDAPSSQARLAALRAEIALRMGDLREAERLAGVALELIPPTSWGVIVGMPLGTLIQSLTAMGELNQVKALLDQPVPDSMFQTRYGLHYIYARGRYNLAADQMAVALRDFEICGDLMLQWRMDVPGLLHWRAGAAEACLRMGRPDQARRLMDAQHFQGGTRLDGNDARIQGTALRLRAGVAEPRHRPRLLRQAADLLQSRDGDRYELARVLHDLAEAHHELGESRRAGIVRRQARAVAKQRNAEPLLRGLSGDEDQESADMDRADFTTVLSDAEQRVAQLAAAGHANRDIADQLFVTVSTVEQHLTRIYRKLGISRRADLPASLEATESPSWA